MELDLGKVKQTDTELYEKIIEINGGVRLGKDADGNPGYVATDAESNNDKIIAFNNDLPVQTAFPNNVYSVGPFSTDPTLMFSVNIGKNVTFCIYNFGGNIILSNITLPAITNDGFTYSFTEFIVYAYPAFLNIKHYQKYRLVNTLTSHKEGNRNDTQFIIPVLHNDFCGILAINFSSSIMGIANITESGITTIEGSGTARFVTLQGTSSYGREVPGVLHIGFVPPSLSFN